MINPEFYLVFPEGDRQEVRHRLRINQLVDMNGFPVSLPLATPKTIVYRVVKVTNREDIREPETLYYLEQLVFEELCGLCG